MRAPTHTRNAKVPVQLRIREYISRILHGRRCQRQKRRFQSTRSRQVTFKFNYTSQHYNPMIRALLWLELSRWRANDLLTFDVTRRMCYTYRSNKFYSAIINARSRSSIFIHWISNSSRTSGRIFSFYRNSLSFCRFFFFLSIISSRSDIHKSRNALSANRHSSSSRSASFVFFGLRRT